MKKNMKHRVLAVSSAVLCVVAMTLSVTVLPGLAYANIAKNPLFAAVLAAAAENNRGQSKSGEGGAEWGAGKEKDKEKTNFESNGAAKGGAAKDSEGVDNKGSKGNSENPNGVGSVSNSNSNGNGAGNGTGDAAGNGAKSGKDADGENKKLNVPANAPKNKSKEKDKQADKNKGKNKNVKDKAKEKAEKKAKKTKGQDRDAGDAGKKLNLEQVKALPACVTVVNMTNSDGTIDTLSIEPPSGESKCAVSADQHSDEFDEIINEIKKLAPTDSSLGFYGGKVYAYGRLSKLDGKNYVGLFSGKNISNIENIEKFDISYVTDMSYLFKDSSLTDFSFLSGWDVSKVTSMKNMFEGCTGLEDISGLSGWKTGKVTDMSNMFEGCTSLKSLDALTNWDVSKVRSMSGMFASIIKNQNQHDAFNPVDGYVGEMAIASVKPLSKWNVGNVMNMNRMFEGCTSITDFTGLEGWDTKSVVAMIGMFEYCKSMSSLKFLEKWNVSNVEYMMAMFALCGNIESTEGLGNWNVSNVTKMDDMFAHCSNLENINALASWNKKDDSNTNKLTSTYRMFYNCSSLTSLQPLSSWNVGSVTDMHDMFNNCGSLTSLDPLKDWNVGSVENMSNMFSSCRSLTGLDPLSSWNVGNVTDMSSMFNFCDHLSNLSGLENWNVGKVEKMSSMFANCCDVNVDDYGNVKTTGLSDISALSKWNVSNVTDMSSMFSSCEALKSIEPLSGWARKASKDINTGKAIAASNVSNVTNMSSMFSGCTNLGNLSGLEKWDVSKVTDMSSMFADCKQLTGAADLSKWDISKVTNLSLMFSNAGADSGDKLVLDFSNKTFTKPSDSKSHFSVDGMFDGFKGTLIANNLQSDGFDNNPEDDPIKSHFAKGEIFSLDENGHSNNIVVTNNVTILDTISSDDDLKKIAYYIPVKAKLMEPGEMGSCKCDGSGDSGGTTYTYYVPALYNSSNLEKKQDEKSQDYAYRVVKNSFASKFRSAIDSQSGKEPGGDEPVDVEGGDDNGDSRSAKQELRVKKLRSARESRSVRDGEGESNTKEKPNGEQGNTYKIMFKKPSASGDTCSWTELGESDDNVPVSEPKSPLIFFTTMYYLETFVQPVPLPHTGGQSAVMFTFLSIGLFSMFAVAGAFGRHGWVASVLPNTALAGFAKAFARRSA